MGLQWFLPLTAISELFKAVGNENMSESDRGYSLGQLLSIIISFLATLFLIWHFILKKMFNKRSVRR